MAPKSKVKKPGDFFFRQIGDKILLTNQSGDFFMVEPAVFDKLSNGKISEDDEEFLDLLERGFLSSKMFRRNIADRVKSKNLFLCHGPSLFIMVLTTRCNLKCAYCHASAGDVSRTELDMDIETAKRIVDVIFSSPSINIGIEFQGGEPMLNWDVLKFVVDYAVEKNRRHECNLMLNLVTNMSLMDDEKLDFLVSRKVGLCTSLDGPKELHNACRRGSYDKTIKNLKKAVDVYTDAFGKYMPAALTTVTREALGKHREIVDEYLKLRLKGIHLRPLNPIGFAGEALGEIGYSAEEFLEFYEKALDYIIEINLGGEYFVERTAWVFLMKIFSELDPNYLDLRSPCGAGIGQIAFNYDGNVYTCDEGRMLAMKGDQTFRMGNVFENGYDDLINSPAVKTVCLASVLDGIPKCESCAYKPYCGVCPLLNYVESGNIFSLVPENRRHKINEAILDMLFHRIQDPKIKEVFFNWLEQGINVI